MVGEICKKCGLKKYNFVFIEDGKICNECSDELQDSEEIKNVIQTTLPGGFIGSWNSTPSYLNKRLGRRYFAIPERQDDNILDGVKYKIIIMEI